MVLFLEFDGKEDLKKGQNLCGIINSPVISFTTKTKKILTRFGVLLPDKTQVILEIWSQDEKSTPKFSNKWSVLQLIIIFNIYYGGDTCIDGKNYKIFRMGCKYEHKFGRFIWLSNDSDQFWYKPISQYDVMVNKRALARDSWPRRVPFGTGFLRQSKGSVISKRWAKSVSSIHTRDFEPFSFEEIIKLHGYVKRGVCGYLNLLTKKPLHKSASFERYVDLNFFDT